MKKRILIELEVDTWGGVRHICDIDLCWVDQLGSVVSYERYNIHSPTVTLWNSDQSPRKGDTSEVAHAGN